MSSQLLRLNSQRLCCRCVVFSSELLTQWLWAQHWQVACVTIPSVWPQGPSAVQVTSALIWLISLMSLFLGGADKRVWPEHAATRRLDSAETLISWPPLTYIHFKHTNTGYSGWKREQTQTRGTNRLTPWFLTWKTLKYNPHIHSCLNTLTEKQVTYLRARNRLCQVQNTEGSIFNLTDKNEEEHFIRLLNLEKMFCQEFKVMMEEVQPNNSFFWMCPGLIDLASDVYASVLGATLMSVFSMCCGDIGL